MKILKSFFSISSFFKPRVVLEDHTRVSQCQWLPPVLEIGKQAEVKAPSAVILLNRFGNLKAIKNMSEKIPAPKNAAINISLINPDIRLKNVSIADWVKPLIKKDVLSLI